MRACILPLLLLVSLLAGCAGQPPKSNHAAPAVSSTAPDTFEEFGRALEESMVNKDPTVFAEHMDAQRFARRSLASLGLSSVKQETVDAYAGILGKALNGRYKEMFAQVESAHFVRLMPGEHGVPDESIALFRIQPEDGGINYWKVYLRRADGRIAIVDWFSYSLGDLASRSLGSFILQAGVAAAKPETAGADAIKGYLTAAQSGDPRKQLAAYERLPAHLKSNSLLMFAQVQTAMKISDQVYHDTLTELAPLYRKNDNYALMLVDYYLFNEQYDKAHAAIDAVARQIGDDAGLDSLHAGIALQTHDYKGAIAYARDGITREAAYEDNYWVLLDALVYSKNYADAVLVLNILEQGFNYEFDAQQMATLEGYEEFARSQAFNSWQSASAH